MREFTVGTMYWLNPNYGRKEFACDCRRLVENGYTLVRLIVWWELVEEKKQYKAGDTVTMDLERDGDPITVELTFDEDTPERRAAQEKALEEQQQEQDQQSQSGSSYDFFWPFGDLSPWFY